MNRRYVLKNRGRFYIFIVMVTIAVSTIFLSMPAEGADTGEAYATVVVESGDTLWDLAREYSNGMDIRRYIMKIEKTNHLSGGTIYEGEVLKMPV